MLTFVVLFFSNQVMAGQNFTCRTVNSGKSLKVEVSYSGEKTGSIAVLDIDGFPPVAIVEKPFRLKPTATGQNLISDEDGAFKYRARMDIPKHTSSTFASKITVDRLGSPPIVAQLNCRH